MSSSLYQEEGVDSKSLEILINGDGNYLKLLNNFTLLYLAFTGNLS